MFGKMQASGLTEIIPFMCTSALWGQTCFLAPLQGWQMTASCIPQLLSIHSGVVAVIHLLDHSFGSPPSHLEPRNHWWMWHFLFMDMAGDIFFSQHETLSHQVSNLELSVIQLKSPSCQSWREAVPLASTSDLPSLPEKLLEAQGESIQPKLFSKETVCFLSHWKMN